MKKTRPFFLQWQNILGLLLVVGFFLLAILAPFLSPDNPKSPGPFQRVEKFAITDREPKPPEAAPPLGTLPGNLDVYHALIWGMRDALKFGLQVAVFTAVIGVIYGAVSAYVGGWLNRLMMRICDSFLAFPVIAGVVLLQQLWFAAIENAGGFYYQGQWLTEPDESARMVVWLLEHLDPLLLTLILFSWMPYARLINVLVSTLKNMDFIHAARAVGAKPARIIFRHLIPNAISPAFVLAARDVGGVVILQATFTFIGISSGSTWGTMLVQGRDWVIGPGGGIFKHWWVFLPATVALMLFGIGWNLLGDGLADLFDPHSKKA
jgi:peptide/nickel transport system permease protein